MHRQWIAMASIVLMLAGGAWAFVGQGQGFSIGAANHIMWPGGVGTVEGGHRAAFAQSQSVAGGWHSPSAFQKEGGIFTQNASAGGSGPACVGQTAKIVGGQHQAAGTWGQPTTSQGQQLGVSFTTNLVKPWGSGTTTASQSFIGGQTQSLMSPTTAGTQSQFVGVTEYANVVGGVATDPVVNNSIKIDLNQGQQTTASIPPCCRP